MEWGTLVRSSLTRVPLFVHSNLVCVCLCVCIALHGDMGTLLVPNEDLRLYTKPVYKSSYVAKGKIGRGDGDNSF